MPPYIIYGFANIGRFLLKRKRKKQKREMFNISFSFGGTDGFVWRIFWSFIFSFENIAYFCRPKLEI
jgi:hypothetical protein